MRGWRREEGIALVEFALILPILIVLMVGIFDVALAVWQSNTLSASAREGTRYAIVNGADSAEPVGPGKDAAVVAAARRHAIGLSNVTVTVTWPDSATTAIASNAAAGQDTVQVASTAGFALARVVHVYSGGIVERHTIKAIESYPARLRFNAPLTNAFGSGTVAAAASRGERVRVVATAPYAPVLSQAFLGGALRVTMSGASELLTSR